MIGASKSKHRCKEGATAALEGARAVLEGDKAVLEGTTAIVEGAKAVLEVAKAVRRQTLPSPTLAQLGEPDIYLLIRGL